MYCPQNGSFTPPQSLRRRQHGHSTEAVPPPHPSFVRQPSPARRGWNNTLDLSICHQPTNPFNNRFALLATPDEPSDLNPQTSYTTTSHTTPTQPLHTFPVPSVRTRNSRGTKEAKKRRDVRRNRRKLAAQMLEEQLGATIDATLTSANIPPPPPARAAYLPTPPSPATELPPSCLSANIARLPPTPPHVPKLDFTPFSTTTFPSLVSSNTTPATHTSSPFAALPPWCPPIPSLTLQDVWRDTLPTFFDLSSLPEPAETPHPDHPSGAAEKGGCKDLQLYRPPLTPGRTTSRFFPPKDSQPVKVSEVRAFGEPERKVKVKLPPTRAALHSADTAPVRDPRGLEKLILPRPKGKLRFMRAKPTRARKAGNHSTEPGLAVSALSSEKEMVLPTAPDKELGAVPDPAEQVLDEATAANLWRILASSHPPTPPMMPTSRARESEYFSTHLPYLPDPYDANYPSLLYPSAVQPCHSPAELDGREVRRGEGREVPYVHANSLTGYSNNSSDTLVPASYDYDYDALQGLQDSGVGLPIVHRFEMEEDDESEEQVNGGGVQDEMVGLNEMVVDHDILLPHQVLGIAAGTALPPSPALLPSPSPHPEHQDQDLGIADVLPVDCVPDNADQHFHDSTAHFRSERALFHPSPPFSPTSPCTPTPSTAGTKQGYVDHSTQTSSEDLIDSLIDVEAFLKLGHARECWCGICDPFPSPSDDSKDVEVEELCDAETALLVDVECEERSDVATTGSELGDEDENEDEEWLIYDSPDSDSVDETGEAGEVAYTPSSPCLHREISGPGAGCGKQDHGDDVCLERRSSEGLLEWEWEWDL